MPEYISREAAREAIFVRVGMRTIGTRLRAAYEEAIDAIDNLPAADVAPVHYAHWEEADWREYDAQSCEIIRYPKEAIVCSDCRNAFKKGTLRIQSFCPACGAKMDGGADHA